MLLSTISLLQKLHSFLIVPASSIIITQSALNAALKITLKQLELYVRNINFILFVFLFAAVGKKMY